MSEPNFIQRALAGDILYFDAEEELENAVDQWHLLGLQEPSLHAFLGLTWAEYKTLAVDSKRLRYIIAARKHELPIEEFSDLDSFSVAARGLDVGDEQELREWLENLEKLDKPRD